MERSPNAATNVDPETGEITAAEKSPYADVILTLKTPWRDCTSHLKFTFLKFLQRLAALVPRPRLHLTRFHGAPARLDAALDLA